MSDFLKLLLGTVIIRPYVFIFLFVYLIASMCQIGWKNSLIYLVIGYLIAFLSEYSSIHCGFPYGLYVYVNKTAGRELWVAGVPFMDSLSYVFLAYCSFSMALFLQSPVIKKGSEVLLLDTRAIRRSWQVLVLGALLMTFLDVIIDPVALLGSKWFLGKIYGYPDGGIYFGVPLSNFGGWFLVALVMIFCIQRLDSAIYSTDRLDQIFSCLPWNSFIGVFLYVGIMGFNITIGYLVKAYPLALVNTLMSALFMALAFSYTIFKIYHVNRDDLTTHLRDFPKARASLLLP